MHSTVIPQSLLSCSMLICLTACGKTNDDGVSSIDKLNVSTYGEELIEEGISTEAIVDDWSLIFVFPWITLSKKTP